MDLTETGIVHDTLGGLFGVPERININSMTCIDFLQKNFLPWYKKQPLAFKRKDKILQDGAPEHTAHLTKDFLDKMGFKSVFNNMALLLVEFKTDREPVGHSKMLR